ncbi:unnamed protein product [Echinostoma caproni]|uniref:G_PROTEIN_RECEP_F1_2 domain-containing protein n=1 Tax=Echinostoma caproni TaxID=27848 RepID=A0A183A0A4_9TREM|nr:unnamed protein product [Echinostoma caproni]
MVDVMFGILSIAMFASNNYTLPCPDGPVNPGVCFLLQSGFISRILRIMAVCIIVFQSVDRFWAIVYPKSYRKNTILYVTLSYAIIICYALLGSMTRLLRTAAVDGSCQLRTFLIDSRTESLIESLLRYVIPMSMLITVNVLVIRKLHHLHGFRFQTGTLCRLFQDTQTEEAAGPSEAPDSITLVQRTIFLSTICLSIQLTVLELISFSLIILSSYRIVDFSINSTTRMYFVFVLALTSVFNPYLEILTIKPLRMEMLNQWRIAIQRFCGRHTETLD